MQWKTKYHVLTCFNYVVERRSSLRSNGLQLQNSIPLKNRKSESVNWLHLINVLCCLIWLNALQNPKMWPKILWCLCFWQEKKKKPKGRSWLLHIAPVGYYPKIQPHASVFSFTRFPYFFLSIPPLYTGMKLSLQQIAREVHFPFTLTEGHNYPTNTALKIRNLWLCWQMSLLWWPGTREWPLMNDQTHTSDLTHSGTPSKDLHVLLITSWVFNKPKRNLHSCTSLESVGRQWKFPNTAAQ